VEGALRKRGVQVRSDSPDWATVQAVLSRGDERLAGVLLGMERETLSAWRAGLRAAGLHAEEYTARREASEALAWDMIDSGIDAEFLQRIEAGVAAGKTPAPCPGSSCTICGVCD